MNGFLYYWSTEKALEPKNFEQLGIPIETFRPTELQVGPNGKRGVLLCEFALAQAGLKAVYNKDEQVWRECVPIGKENSGEDLWIGMYRDSPPEPSDLEVDRLTPGEDVLLGDGKKWYIPHCRICQFDPPGADCGLPQVYRHGRDGWGLEPVLEHAELWEHLGEWFADCYSLAVEEVADIKAGDDVELNDKRPTIGQGLDWSIKTIGLNYKVGRPELSLLGVFSGRGRDAADMTEMKDVLDVASGWSAFLDYLQKKSQEQEVPVG